MPINYNAQLCGRILLRAAYNRDLQQQQQQQKAGNENVFQENGPTNINSSLLSMRTQTKLKSEM